MEIFLQDGTPDNIKENFEKAMKAKKITYTISEKGAYIVDVTPLKYILPQPWIQKINILPQSSLYKKLFNGKELVFIAGPCSIENKEMILSIGKEVQREGADILRGGAFKARTSAYSFQGLGEEALSYLIEAKKRLQMPIISEMTSIDQLDIFNEAVDIVQIGARNMQNFVLIEAAASLKKPMLIKRGPGATLFEYIKALEYAYINGNGDIILCERGIRTFERTTRYTIDMSAIPILQQETKLPVLLDPSHGTGRSDLIYSMALGGVAAGADGLMIEVHHEPETAKSDSGQLITTMALGNIIKKAKAIKKIL